MLIDEIIRRCYNNIIDEESKKIYINRVLYNTTGDPRFMKKIIFGRDVFRDLYHVLRNHSNQKIILFGAGPWSDGVLSPLKEFYDTVPYCYVDNNAKEGDIRNGLKVLTFRELLESYRDACILITSWGGKYEIFNQLINAGFSRDNVINLPLITDYYIHRQYFDLPFFSFDENEVFVDAGACDGSTSRLFAEKCGNKYKYIYAFEPNSFMQSQLQNTFQSLHGEIIPKGTWSKSTSLYFLENGQGSFLSEDEISASASRVDVCSIDDLRLNPTPTFIKLDVEGAEIQTITGAEKLIQEYKPKIAVCLYHKHDDPWSIPDALLHLNPSYHFCLRHYFFDARETVMYAF